METTETIVLQSGEVSVVSVVFEIHTWPYYKVGASETTEPTELTETIVLQSGDISVVSVVSVVSEIHTWPYFKV